MQCIVGEALYILHTSCTEVWHQSWHENDGENIYYQIVFESHEPLQKYQLTGPANSARKWFFHHHFYIKTCIKLPGTRNLQWRCLRLVLLSDTYIQKLNSQEHSCSWVHIYIRQQLAPLPDEIPSCSNHFRGSQNWTCRCRLKRIKIHKTYMQ